MGAKHRELSILASILTMKYEKSFLLYTEVVRAILYDSDFVRNILYGNNF